MKNKFRINVLNYVFLIGIMALFSSGFIIFIEFKKQENQCLQNPLVFGSKWMENKYGLEFQGYGYLKTEKGNLVPVAFNSTTLVVNNP